MASRWASVTKLCTAYAVLIASEEGLLDLDGPAGPPDSTVRHLLAHASGLPFDGSTPIAPPGRRRIYSNTGMDLLGALLGERAGCDFAAFLNELVLAPLGIDAHLSGRPSEGMVGDAVGLARFASELLNSHLIDPDTRREATTVAFPGLPGVLPGVGRFDPLDWGLGFEIRSAKHPHWTGTKNSPSTFGHFGGSGAFLWVDPEVDLAVCCLAGRDFGDWALAAWPALSDAILAEASVYPPET